MLVHAGMIRFTAGGAPARTGRAVRRADSAHNRLPEGTMTRHWPLVLVLIAAACRSAAPVASPQAPPGAPAPAVEATPTPAAAPSFRASTAIRWVRDSAEHRAVFLQIYRQATAHVEQEALARPAGSWAVVLDGDEAVLDNSLYQLEREAVGLGFDRDSWRAWTVRKEAVPLPGVAAFLTRVKLLGGMVAIVTNRTETECPDTEAVFLAHGVPFDLMLCKPDDGPSDKAGRFEAITLGTTSAGLPPLDIVAFLGDNILDFPGGSQALRQQGDEAFAEFGVRYFIFPNPMYGSWN
jgi:5'-nucleotidase (lipoprotein e(P4) family)